MDKQPSLDAMWMGTGRGCQTVC